MKDDSSIYLQVNILEQVPLALPLSICFFLLRVFNFPHKIAFTITMQPGPVFIDTQVCCNIFLIELKTSVCKEALKAVSKQ